MNSNHPTGPATPTTLAVVDMGSNSFRLELGRVEGTQIFRLDTWRETLRLGAEVDAQRRLTRAGQEAALATLARFGERLRGLQPSAVRAVATNTFRVATNAGPFLAKAERTLGFPIDVITGHEEARLIYMGVTHLLPASAERRLVVDIGGGSTEFILGRGLVAEQLESLAIGCVGMSQRFFADGRLTVPAFRDAETAARAEVEAIAGVFARDQWDAAYASSGTALALADILDKNALSSGGITRDGLARLRKRMIAAGHVRRVELAALKPQRAPVLAGGLAIMAAVLDELDVERIDPVGGALRLGVLYDLLGRTEHHDARGGTIAQFLKRYHVDVPHAQRVAALALDLFQEAPGANDEVAVQRLEWAALLHEIGLSVSHHSFHKHGAYIIEHADMPGFSAGEQRTMSRLVLGCRGGLTKMVPHIDDETFRAQLLALRLAVLFHHARRAIDLPRITLKLGDSVRFEASSAWLKAHPLSEHLLGKEREEWASIGMPWDV